MSRTVPSFRMLLEGIIGELSDFRRALRGEDKAAFDSLMNKAREHASSCIDIQTLDLMHAIFLSILVEQEKEISSLCEASSTDAPMNCTSATTTFAPSPANASAEVLPIPELPPVTSATLPFKDPVISAPLLYLMYLAQIFP